MSQELEDYLNDDTAEETAEAEAQAAAEGSEADAGKEGDDAPGDDKSKESDDKAKETGSEDGDGKGEEGAETPSAEDDEKENWTKKAVLDERRKRQALQQKLDQLEAESQKPNEERPDVYGDPEGAFSHLEKQFADQLEQQTQSVRLEMSQEMMRIVKDDYDELESEFIDMARDNPALIQELNQASNPAKFAYETATKAREAAELKDVDTYKAQLKAAARAEVEAELKKEAEEAAKKDAEKAAAATTSIANERSSVTPSKAVSDDIDLDELLSKR